MSTYFGHHSLKIFGDEWKVKQDGKDHHIVFILMMTLFFLLLFVVL